jgi:ATP-dependent DNA helicase RecQ
LFESLRTWRAETAREKAVPAYVIFHDSTLRVIATTRPDSLEELAAAPGVGQAKLAAYGETVLQLVRDTAGGHRGPSD